MATTDVSVLYHNFKLATFIITYKCPISCPMCFFASGPDRKEVLPRELALKVLEESHELEIEAIGIAGGEPFLNMRLMRELIEKAASFKMTIIVVTNAYWATSTKAALHKLSGLKELGLQRLQISLDDQHQQFIPIERVANAARAATELGFEDIKILGSSIGNSEKFKFQLVYLEKFLGLPTNDMDLIDRARTSHQYYEDKAQVRYAFADLEQADRLGLPVKRPGDCLSEMMLDVNGDIYPCCNNFVGRIGNAYQNSFREMVERLPLNQYFRIIKEEGPFELARYLDRRQGTRFSQGRYGNWCELCAQVFQNERFRDLLISERPATADESDGYRPSAGTKKRKEVIKDGRRN
jgi:MoaA/NifB/PqqE/SkfB family radical SAM enzyme